MAMYETIMEENVPHLKREFYKYVVHHIRKAVFLGELLVQDSENGSVSE